jgi:hypothetical protein
MEEDGYDFEEIDIRLLAPSSTEPTKLDVESLSVVVLVDMERRTARVCDDPGALLIYGFPPDRLAWTCFAGGVEVTSVGRIGLGSLSDTENVLWNDMLPSLLVPLGGTGSPVFLPRDLKGDEVFSSSCFNAASKSDAILSVRYLSYPPPYNRVLSFDMTSVMFEFLLLFRLRLTGRVW